ncbi:hypothetical protein G6F22_021863 [Rhizopus arrhizus]|nr:hypothetical protein G6F22_021863 [Rhizopus arrhizus]
MPDDADTTRLPAQQRNPGRRRQCAGAAAGLHPPRAGDSRQPPYRHDPRCRTHRDLHAGEPFVRPLFRWPGGRARLWRPIPHPRAG